MKTKVFLAPLLYTSFTRISERMRINWVSPSNRVLFGKSTDHDPLKISPHFLKPTTRVFITLFTTVHHFHLTRGRSLYSMSSILFLWDPFEYYLPTHTEVFPSGLSQTEFFGEMLYEYSLFSTRAMLAAHLILLHLNNLIIFGSQSVKWSSNQ